MYRLQTGENVISTKFVFDNFIRAVIKLHQELDPLVNPFQRIRYPCDIVQNTEKMVVKKVA